MWLLEGHIVIFNCFARVKRGCTGTCLSRLMETKHRREPKLSDICVSPSHERRLTNNAAWLTGGKARPIANLYCPVIFAVVVTQALLTSESKYRSTCKLGRVEVYKYSDVYVELPFVFAAIAWNARHSARMFKAHFFGRRNNSRCVSLPAKITTTLLPVQSWHERKKNRTGRLNLDRKERCAIRSMQFTSFKEFTFHSRVLFVRNVLQST